MLGMLVNHQGIRIRVRTDGFMEPATESIQANENKPMLLVLWLCTNVVLRLLDSSMLETKIGCFSINYQSIPSMFGSNPRK